MTTLLHKHWHHLPESEVIDLVDVQPDTGLDNFEIEERRQTYGVNTLTIKKGKGPLLRFFLQFHQALVYILLIAIGIKLYLGGWVDAGVILAVVVLNAIIGFIQESKALHALSALSKVLVTEAVVLRAKEKHRINARELVPGDIVLLQSGDKVPADIRLLHSRELQIDESIINR